VICPAHVLALSRARLIGASGTTESFKTAPFPGVDYPETPIALIATILANTLVPFVNDQGEAISLCTVIVHYIAETIELNCPLQSAVFSVYVVKSLYLILIL
jgi:hypothetical protein